MFQQKKPYSAVTVTIENLTGEAYDEDDFSGIPELVEVIKLQASGPTEAARALRKKLKYGSPHRQIRALVILDGLLQNAGPRFQRTFVDEPLLERLRVCGTSNLSDPDVRKKCVELFRGWSAYAKTPGLQKISQLHKELPKRKVAMTQERSKVVQETENPFEDDEEEEARNAAQKQVAGGSSSSAPAPKLPTQSSSSSRTGSLFGSSKDKKDKSKAAPSKRKPFNIEAEKEQMKVVIADASIASTTLLNIMQTINRETERISDNQGAVERFEQCKTLRRRVLRYIHKVDQEQWLGSLLNANDVLVHALMSYEQLDRSIDADSDSDDELAEQAHIYRMITSRANDSTESEAQSPSLANLSINPPAAHGKSSELPPPPQPPRPVIQRKETETDDDDDDPFGDKNVVETPAFERGEPRW